MFKPSNLTTLGRDNLRKAGLPTIFDDWIALVEAKLGKRAKRLDYDRHWQHGRTPDEAIELVAADKAAEEIAQEVFRRCNEAYQKIGPRHFKFGAGHIAECVAVIVQRAV